MVAASRTPLGLLYLTSSPSLPYSFCPLGLPIPQQTRVCLSSAQSLHLTEAPETRNGLLPGGRGADPTAAGWPARRARPETPSRCHRSLRAEAPGHQPCGHGRCRVPAAWRCVGGNPSTTWIPRAPKNIPSGTLLCPKPARTPPRKTTALEPEVGGKASARLGPMEGDAECLPLQGTPRCL